MKEAAKASDRRGGVGGGGGGGGGDASFLTLYSYPRSAYIGLSSCKESPNRA